MKLKYLYLNKEPELYAGVGRLMAISLELQKNKEYDIEYLSARAGLPVDMCKDILEYLCIGGFYSKNKAGYYYVLE